MPKKKVKWMPEPAPKDYEAAAAFLRLLYPARKVAGWTRELKRAKMSAFLAKDILRASGTPMSEVHAFDWSKQQKEIDRGTPLSPMLLVRQDNGGHLIVADGFHRLCALFANDQEVTVPCKIV